MDTNLLYIIIGLIVMNVAVIWYARRTFIYTLRGRHFLQHTHTELVELGETQAARDLENLSLPFFNNVSALIRASSQLVFLVIGTNAVFAMFAIYPELQNTVAWTIMMVMSAISNAFVLMSAQNFHKFRYYTNMNCNHYENLLRALQNKGDNNDQPE